MSELGSLHRYFIWANWLRGRFLEVAEIPGADPVAGTDAWFAGSQVVFLSYWYAALYVVVEGWQRLKLSDPQANALLSSPHVAMLKRYRHGVCHFQPTYFDSRFVEFVSSPGGASWAGLLHAELGKAISRI